MPVPYYNGVANQNPANGATPRLVLGTAPPPTFCAQAPQPPTAAGPAWEPPFPLPADLPPKFVPVWREVTRLCWARSYSTTSLNAAVRVNRREDYTVIQLVRDVARDAGQLRNLCCGKEDRWVTVGGPAEAAVLEQQAKIPRKSTSRPVPAKRPAAEVDELRRLVVKLALENERLKAGQKP